MPADRSHLGVYLDDFQASPRDALRLASGMGFGAVQIGVAAGPLAPNNLSASGRRQLKHFAAGLGLNIVALRADLGGARLLDRAAVDGHLDRIRKILQLARDLQVSIVAAPLGKFRIADEREYSLALEAATHIAEQADKLDRTFALETAVASADALPQLLRQVSCRQLKICYDPAELLMEGIEPLEPIGHLAGDIVLAMARDAERGAPGRAGRETNLGGGHLDLAAYLAQLEAAGYPGALIVRRSHTANPRSDLRACKQHLDSILESGTHRGSY